MWLINSSIGRKVVMSVTGIALILFLTFHALMNVVSLISARGYNMICEFLGANWYALVGTAVLAVLVVLHFVFAIWLTLQNRKARGNNRYAITSKPEKVEWASQNMFVLGIIVVLGLLLHFWNFWYNMMYAELAHVENAISAIDGTAYIVRTFSCPIFTIIYIVWLVALWFHLNHGFWSAIQTIGWNGKVWFCRWRAIATIYTTILILLFAAVAIAFCFGYRPADYAQRLEPQQQLVCPIQQPQGCAPICASGCLPECTRNCSGECRPGCPCECNKACVAPVQGANRGDAPVRGHHPHSGNHHAQPNCPIK